jgi:hypothetical protein
MWKLVRTVLPGYVAEAFGYITDTTTYKAESYQPLLSIRM